MSQSSSSNRSEGRRTPLTAWLFAGGALLGFGFLVTQAFRYISTMFRAGEWQFARPGIYYPVLTIGLVIGLLLLIGWLVRWLMVRARRRRAAEAGEAPEQAVPPLTEAARLGRSLDRWVAGLWLLLAGGIAAMVITLMLMARLPSGEGRVRTYDDRALAAGLTEGPARIVAPLDIDNVAMFTTGLFLWRYETYFAPVATGGSQPMLFVEVTHDEAFRHTASSVHQGVLRRDALPEELGPLIARRAIVAPPGHAVLFRNVYSLRWRHWIALIQAGLFSAVAGFILWRLRRIRADYHARVGKTVADANWLT